MNCQDRKLFEELEQENAALRARWEKLKEFIDDMCLETLALYETDKIKAKFEELEQDE